MILLSLILALSQEPTPAPLIGWERLDSSAEEDQVLFRFTSLRSQVKDQKTSADRAVLALDRKHYEALLGGDTAAKPNKEQTEKILDRRLLGGWETRLLAALGLPNEEGLVRFLLLEGKVSLQRPGALLTCDRLRYDQAQGQTKILKVDLFLPPSSGLRGWPLRLLCEELTEFQDGRLVAKNALLTTCDIEPPHFALRLDQVVGQPLTPQGWSWKPKGTWLEIGNYPILPLPSPEISTTTSGDDSFFGLRSFRVGSNNSLGESLRLDLGTSGRTEANTLWSATVQPTWSTRRGWPLSSSFSSDGDFWQANWSLFTLNDQGRDAHPFSRRLATPGDNRWLATSDHRIELPNQWRADVNLAFASDPLIMPEFFRSAWETREDLQSELYLRHPGKNDFTELSLSGVTDTAGYSPTVGFSATAPLYREDLPRIRHESFPRTLDLDIFGESFSLDFSWGANFSRIQLRDLDPLALAGTPDFLEGEELRFDRLHLWSEVSSPIQARGLVFRPGLRADWIAWSGEMENRREATLVAGEGFLEISSLLIRSYEDGWKHRLRPMLRFRARGTQGQDSSMVPQADFVDSLDSGEVIELSLRQFFLAPGSSEPWLDLDFMLPWFPDASRPLLDPLFPGLRADAPAGSGLGPAELRAAWRPGKATPSLEGWTVDAGLRQDLELHKTEEFFARLGVRASKDLQLGLSLRKVEDLFSYGELWGNWRLAQEWALAFRLPHAFAFAPAQRTRLSLSWYAHDFVLQFEGVQNDATGETGVSFNILPRFLIEPPQRGPRSGG